MDLKRVVYASWERFGDRPCVVDEDQRFTFDQIVRRVVALSRFVARHDRSETGHVGMILPNSEAFITAFFGCLAADRAVVPVNCLLSPPEAGFILRHARCEIVLTTSAFRPLIEAMNQEEGPSIRPFYLDEPAAQIGGALDAADPAVLLAGESDPDRPACLIYTSGTTGIAKGVVLTHRNLVANGDSMLQVLEVRAEDVFLAVLPFFHSFGLTTTLLLPLLAGSNIVIMRRFHPATAVDLIEREKITVFLAVASMFALVMRGAASNPSRLSTVRIAISGGGPLSPALGEAFEKTIGFPLLQGYGLTEAAPVVATNFPGHVKAPSVGPPVPGVEAEIRDDHDRRLPAGEIGEICVHGENVMREYYRNPEASAQALDANGWLRTGDVGYIDEEGFLYVTSRKKDIIIFGGEKIFPQEVEHVLISHPDVEEAAVVGIQDPMRGEFPRAFLVLREGVESINERELRHFCADRMATFKIPRDFQVVDALPKNALGKVQKHKLVESAAQ